MKRTKMSSVFMLLYAVGMIAPAAATAQKPYWTKCDYFWNCGVVQCTEGTNNCSCPPDGGTSEG